MTALPHGCSRSAAIRSPVRLAVVAAVAVLAAGLGGCSSVPDELNPVSWVEAVSDAISGDDAQPSPEDQARAEAERAQSVPGADQPFPSLGAVPDAPPEVTPEDERQAIAQGLIADRANAQYSEPVSLPDSVMAPPSVALAESPASVAPAVLPPASDDGGVIGEGSAEPVSPEPAPASVRVTETAVVAPLPPPSRPMETAAVTPPPPPRRPATTAAVTPPPPPPTRAPTPPIVAPPPAPPPAAVNRPPERRLDGGFRPLETFDPLVIQQSQQAGVIYFAHGSAKLSRQDRQVLAQVAAARQAYGGSIRVIGHASSRPGSRQVASTQTANLVMSMKRAEAVARELARLGVDPSYIYVGGAADADPRYSEVTRMGEAANRRTDIYLDYWRRG